MATPSPSYTSTGIAEHNAEMLARLPPDAAAHIGAITHPQTAADLALACFGFAGVLALGCGAHELLNSRRLAGLTGVEASKRHAQVLQEVSESFVPVLCSTAFTLWWFRCVFPLRWGFPAPVAPLSLWAALVDSCLWLLNFEVAGYWTHRFLHLHKFCGLSVYERVHQPHHRYRQPTAFAAQAITGLEGVWFAATSVLVSLVWPTSHLVQFGLGSFMLFWSIAAHDSDGRLDRGCESPAPPHTCLIMLACTSSHACTEPPA